jgi:hypothetical protein
MPSAVAQLARAEKLPAGSEALLRSAATDSGTDHLTRSYAVMALSKVSNVEAAAALLKAMPAVYAARDSGREANDARQAFLRSHNAGQQIAFYRAEAAQLNDESPWADAVLIVTADSKNAPENIRKEASEAIEEGWKQPKRRAQILKAIALAEHRASRDRVLESLEDPGSVRRRSRKKHRARLAPGPRTQARNQPADWKP